ncbi:hypothetical protein GCM10007216_32660 [Thalassobacillus devorans]|uniref:Uncharacterized protein n=1 Tax=Thalassobacillus devorans TaxID=279813 RepID=A0ABQ1PLW2_9BACI|nr:hypothetical protein [Thalassobacillus devorans]NIK30226.1 hypothetical protein [Thalassobacillus devorans]GGC99409.1 hypothetical protein GCM10007216_32660 [Thalassobacillus devorans]
MEWDIASLTEEQTRRIMELESELGYVLIAYDDGKHGFTTSDEKVDYYAMLHGSVEE